MTRIFMPRAAKEPITHSEPASQGFTDLSTNRYYEITRQLWEEWWSRPDFTPFWRLEAIPHEVQDAVTGTWFPQGSLALDIGCGGGEIAAWLAERGMKVLGIDYAQAAIDRAKARWSKHGRQLRFKRMDICLDVPGRARYEVLLDRGCFHVIPETLAPTYAAHVGATARPGAHFLLLYSLQLRPGELDSWDKEVRRKKALSYLASTFSPLFDITRMDNTYLVKSADPAESVPGLAIWMIRRR